MQTVLQIIVAAGGWYPGLSLKIENSPFMPLAIEGWMSPAPWDSPQSLSLITDNRTAT